MKDVYKASLPPSGCCAFCTAQKRESKSPLGDGDRKRNTDRFTRWRSDRQRFRLMEQKGRHKRHREREAENSNLGSFLVKLHQGELLLNFFSLMRCLCIIGDSEFIINGYKLIH